MAGIESTRTRSGTTTRATLPNSLGCTTSLPPHAMVFLSGVAIPISSVSSSRPPRKSSASSTVPGASENCGCCRRATGLGLIAWIGLAVTGGALVMLPLVLFAWVRARVTSTLTAASSSTATMIPAMTVPPLSPLLPPPSPPPDASASPPSTSVAADGGEGAAVDGDGDGWAIGGRLGAQRASKFSPSQIPPAATPAEGTQTCGGTV